MQKAAVTYEHAFYGVASPPKVDISFPRIMMATHFAVICCQIIALWPT